MSLTFIRHREVIETVSYRRHFDSREHPGSGFGFDCDEQGELLPERRNEDALENLRKCLSGEYDVVDRGVQRYVGRYTEPAAVRCVCGAEIVLDDGMTNECGRCGLLCNGSGQELAPVEQWDAEDRYACFGPRNAPDDY